jgi:hypothetical protein
LGIGGWCCGGDATGGQAVAAGLFEALKHVRGKRVRVEKRSAQGRCGRESGVRVWGVVLDAGVFKELEVSRRRNGYTGGAKKRAASC